MTVLSSTADATLSAELRRLSTEATDPRFAHIDQASVADLATLMNAAEMSVPKAVEQALPAIVPAIESTAKRMQRGGRLVYVGAGTSGRIGVLDASECPPTFSSPPEQVFAIIAGGPEAIVVSREGAEDDPDSGAAAIDAAQVGPDDTVVGIASSGRTPFVLGAVRRAGERGAATVGISCNAVTELSALVDHPIELLVGPEIISGSTRLKAGTAQKQVLNMFSTIVMVQLGKTYGNLMVDVKATNVKLRERAVRMVCTIADVSREGAIAALEATGYNVKLAAISLRFGVDAADAAARLQRHEGRLRAALEEQP